MVVDAFDPTGEPATFTQYGETTTDVMAPGSTILSTWATGEAGGANGPNYLGEEDEEAVLYESFDDESHASAPLGEGQTGVANSDGDDAHAVRGTYLSFSSKAGASSIEVREDGKRFDGKAALELSYDPISDNNSLNVVASDPHRSFRCGREAPLPQHPHHGDLRRKRTRLCSVKLSFW